MIIHSAVKLRHIRVFSELADEGTLSAVAGRQGITQPALTRTLQEFTQTSLAIADALRIPNCPVIELHLANIHRDPAQIDRHLSLVRPVATGDIADFGPHGYLMALGSVAMGTNPSDFRAAPKA